MDDLTKKALERLVSALIADVDKDQTRSELIEEAVSYAALALGMSPPNYADLVEQLDTVAVQMVIEKVKEDGLKVYQVVIADEDDNHICSIFATSDSAIVSQIVEAIEGKNKSKDYSVN